MTKSDTYRQLVFHDWLGKKGALEVDRDGTLHERCVDGALGQQTRREQDPEEQDQMPGDGKQHR